MFGSFHIVFSRLAVIVISMRHTRAHTYTYIVHTYMHAYIHTLYIHTYMHLSCMLTGRQIYTGVEFSDGRGYFDNFGASIVTVAEVCICMYVYIYVCMYVCMHV